VPSGTATASLYGERIDLVEGGRCRRAEAGAWIDQVVVAVGAVSLLESATSRVSGDHLARFGRLARTEVLSLDARESIFLLANRDKFYKSLVVAMPKKPLPTILSDDLLTGQPALEPPKEQ